MPRPALFKLTQRLNLKHPFDNAVLYGKCRDYIMDSLEYDSMIVIDIWDGTRGRQEWLRVMLRSQANNEASRQTRLVLRERRH
jgi:hypothetical protein